MPNIHTGELTEPSGNGAGQKMSTCEIMKWDPCLLVYIKFSPYYQWSLSPRCLRLLDKCTGNTLQNINVGVSV